MSLSDGGSSAKHVVKKKRRNPRCRTRGSILKKNCSICYSSGMWRFCSQEKLSRPWRLGLWACGLVVWRRILKPFLVRALHQLRLSLPSAALEKNGCGAAFLISFSFGSLGRKVLKRDITKWARVVGSFQLCLLDLYFLGSNLMMWESNSIHVGCNLLT